MINNLKNFLLAINIKKALLRSVFEKIKFHTKILQN